MTTPRPITAALDAAYAEYKEVIGDIDAGDRLVIRRSIAAYLAAARSTVPEAGKAVDEEPVGWAYQDKRWDKGRWHVCGLDSKPRAHEGREIRAIYIASNGTALASVPAPSGAETTSDIAGLVDGLAELSGKFALANDEGYMFLVHEAAAALTSISAERDLFSDQSNNFQDRLVGSEAEATFLRRKLEEATDRENILREALERARDLTPAAANAHNARDLHLTISAIAGVALDRTISGASS